MIVDTHVHVVSDDTAAYPQASDAPHWPLTTGDILLDKMDDAGIDRALLVQTYFTYGYDNRYLADVAAAHSDRFLGICILDPLAPESADELSRLVEERGIRGIRLMNDRGRMAVTLDDPATFPLWRRIAELGIPVCVGVLREDVHRAAVPLERFPEVTVALDHIWGLTLDDGPGYGSLAPLFALARHPNLVVKIAVNNSFAVRKGGGVPEQFYGLLLERFGPKRIMWGSNYPAHAQAYGDLPARLALARQDLAFLGAADRDLILGGNACRLWPALG